MWDYQFGLLAGHPIQVHLLLVYLGGHPFVHVWFKPLIHGFDSRQDQVVGVEAVQKVGQSSRQFWSLADLVPVRIRRFGVKSIRK